MICRLIHSSWKFYNLNLSFFVLLNTFDTFQTWRTWQMAFKKWNSYFLHSHAPWDCRTEKCKIQFNFCCFCLRFQFANANETRAKSHNCINLFVLLCALLMEFHADSFFSSPLSLLLQSSHTFSDKRKLRNERKKQSHFKKITWCCLIKMKNLLTCFSHCL